MFKNITMIAFRSMLKQKLNTIINILGLAIGLTCFITLFLTVRTELSFDEIHENSDRIYKVFMEYERESGNSLRGETFSGLAEHIKLNHPQVEQTVRLGRKPLVVKNKRETFTEQVTFADPSIFEVFTFHIEEGKGNVKDFDLSSVILSEKKAYKYFGNSDPLNKILSVRIGDKFYDFKVIAVAKETPYTSSVKFEILLHFNFTEKADYDQNANFFTYALLNQSNDFRKVNGKYFPFGTGPQTSNIKYGLQPLPDVHLNSEILGSLEPQGNLTFILILASLSILLLIVAVINFINIMIARSAQRFKEMGIRKILGSFRNLIIIQILYETLLHLLISLSLSIILLELFNGNLSELFKTEINFSPFQDIELLTFLGILVLVSTVLCGLYPAVVISKNNPIGIIKSSYTIRSFSRTSKILLTIQYSLSIFLIGCAIIISEQMTYLFNKDKGYTEDNVIIVKIPQGYDDKIFEKYKDQLRTSPRVLNIFASAFSIGSRFNGRYLLGAYKDDKSVASFFFKVDPNFISTIGLRLIEGRNFDESFSTDKRDAIIVNKEFIKKLGLQGAADEYVDYMHGRQLKIIGVVENFHFFNVKSDVYPIALSMFHYPYESIYIKIESDNIPETIRLLKEKWDMVAPNMPFNYSFLEEDIDIQLREEINFNRIFSLSSSVTVVLAAIGLFGIISISLFNRKKEFGIRKIMGASSINLFINVLKNYFFIISLGVIIAWPATHYAMTKWLQQFSYKIDFDYATLLYAWIIAIAVSFLTVAAVIIKSVWANPVDTLRYE